MSKVLGLILVFILIINETSFGNDIINPANNIVSVYDRTWSGYNTFDTSILTKFRNDPDFFYTYKKEKVDNILLIILYKISELISGLFNHKATPYIFYILFGIIFLYLLLKLFDKKIQNIIIISGRNHIKSEINEVSLQAEKYDQMIEQALKEGNFQIAIRYHYLKLLTLLSTNKIINWKSDKTNTEYVQEITNKELKIIFKELSGTYDYVWYGKFQVDNELFGQIKERFNNLYNKVSNWTEND